MRILRDKRSVIGGFTAVSLDIFGVERFVVDSNQDQQGL